jgi:hypothetical protein
MYLWNRNLVQAGNPFQRQLIDELGNRADLTKPIGAEEQPLTSQASVAGTDWLDSMLDKTEQRQMAPPPQIGPSEDPAATTDWLDQMLAKMPEGAPKEPWNPETSWNPIGGWMEAPGKIADSWKQEGEELQKKPWGEMYKEGFIKALPNPLGPLEVGGRVLAGSLMFFGGIGYQVAGWQYLRVKDWITGTERTPDDHINLIRDQLDKVSSLIPAEKTEMAKRFMPKMQAAIETFISPTVWGALKLRQMGVSPYRAEAFQMLTELLLFHAAHVGGTKAYRGVASIPKKIKSAKEASEAIDKALRENLDEQGIRRPKPEDIATPEARQKYMDEVMDAYEGGIYSGKWTVEQINAYRQAANQARMNAETKVAEELQGPRKTVSGEKPVAQTNMEARQAMEQSRDMVQGIQADPHLDALHQVNAMRAAQGLEPYPIPQRGTPVRPTEAKPVEPAPVDVRAPEPVAPPPVVEPRRTISGEKSVAQTNREARQAMERSRDLVKGLQPDKPITAIENVNAVRADLGLEPLPTPKAATRPAELVRPAEAPKPAASVEIPTLKSTNEAFEFGRRATPEQIAELKRLEAEYRDRAQKLREDSKKPENAEQAMDMLQESMNEATKAQFYREAHEYGEGKITPPEGMYKPKDSEAPKASPETPSVQTLNEAKPESPPRTKPTRVEYSGEIVKEVHELFEALDVDPKYKRMKKFDVDVTEVEPGQAIDIPATWHDAVYRMTALKGPDGKIMPGRGGSYDTILSEGQVAGAKQGQIPPGHTLYVLDIGGQGTVAQTRRLRIFRAKEATQAIDVTPRQPALSAPSAPPISEAVVTRKLTPEERRAKRAEQARDRRRGKPTEVDLERLPEWVEATLEEIYNERPLTDKGKPTRMYEVAQALLETGEIPTAGLMKTFRKWYDIEAKEKQRIAAEDARYIESKRAAEDAHLAELEKVDPVTGRPSGTAPKTEVDPKTGQTIETGKFEPIEAPERGFYKSEAQVLADFLESGVIKNSKEKVIKDKLIAQMYAEQAGYTGKLIRDPETGGWRARKGKSDLESYDKMMQALWEERLKKEGFEDLDIEAGRVDVDVNSLSSNQLNTMIPLDAVPQAVMDLLRTTSKGLGQLRAFLSKQDSVAFKDLYRNKDIYDGTGFWLAKDGKWRYEIDDVISSFRLLAGNLSEYPSKLPDIYKNKKLYQAVPEMKDVKVQVNTAMDTPAGYRPSAKTILIKDQHAPDFAESFFHELQHAVNEVSGAFIGTNLQKATIETISDLYKRVNDLAKDPMIGKDVAKALLDHNSGKRDLYQGLDNLSKQYKSNPVFISHGRTIDNILKDSTAFYIDTNARKRYFKTPGEMEARLNERRMRMTPEEKKAIPPWETLDTMLLDKGHIGLEDFKRIGDKTFSETGSTLYDSGTATGMALKRAYDLMKMMVSHKGGTTLGVETTLGGGFYMDLSSVGGKIVKLFSRGKDGKPKVNLTANQIADIRRLFDSGKFTPRDLMVAMRAKGISEDAISSIISKTAEQAVTRGPRHPGEPTLQGESKYLRKGDDPNELLPRRNKGDGTFAPAITRGEAHMMATLRDFIGQRTFNENWSWEAGWKSFERSADINGRALTDTFYWKIKDLDADVMREFKGKQKTSASYRKGLDKKSQERIGIHALWSKLTDRWLLTRWGYLRDLS